MQASPIRTRISEDGAGVVGGADVESTMVQLLVALTAAESRTAATKELEPGTPGNPVIAPVEGVRVKPAGSDPVIENV